MSARHRTAARGHTKRDVQSEARVAAPSAAHTQFERRHNQERQMNTVENLTTHLSDVFEKLLKNELEVKQADALANVAGKIIKANLGQLAYYDQRKETPHLPFWALK
jgi:hypothetical protein